MKHPDHYSSRACKGMDLNLFHPGPHSPLISKARAVCNGCPIATECLQWALDMEQQDGKQMDGIWGGLTGTERANLHATQH